MQDLKYNLNFQKNRAVAVVPAVANLIISSNLTGVTLIVYMSSVTPVFFLKSIFMRDIFLQKD